MLCDAPRNDHDHYMLTEPEASGANYFDMVPLARLTMAIYEEVKFDRSFRSLSLYLSLSLSRSLFIYLSLLSLTLKSKMPSPSPSPSSLYTSTPTSRVIVKSGAIYDSFSPMEGDVYSGDMRENVGKAQVGTFSAQM